MKLLTTIAALATTVLGAGGYLGLPPGGPAGPAWLIQAEEDIAQTPPAPRWPDDPADSLYQQARSALGDGRFRQAAAMFAEIVERYPQSKYAADALYWRAFALYRSGGGDDLHTALRTLDEQAKRYPRAATRSDAEVLTARIEGMLARRGDATARASVEQRARSERRRERDDEKRRAGGDQRDRPTRGGEDCGEENGIRIAALNALQQMDEDQALPILRDVLARRDECSARLREKAVFLVAQHGSAESGNLLLDVVRTDPDPQVRRAAVQWMGEVRGARTLSTLDSLLRRSTDPELRERAIFALSQQDDPLAAQALRRALEDPSTPDEVKAKVIFALGHYGNPDHSSEYLRSLYPKLQSEGLKREVIQSVAQDDEAGSATWLLGLARNSAEPVDLRKHALFWAGQNAASVADLAGFYDTAKDHELREQALFVLSQREEREATDKLLAVARAEREPRLRERAIFWLAERRDPRVKQLLLEILDAPNPR